MYVFSFLTRSHTFVPAAQLLGAALDRSPYDVVCLQEVFWANAGQVLRAGLAKTFPHIVDKGEQHTQYCHSRLCIVLSNVCAYVCVFCVRVVV